MAGTFELKRSKDGQYRFILKAGNGRVILVSETYRERKDAVGGIDSVRKNSPNGGRYERKTSSQGEPYFVLTATNGRTIGQSEMYSSTAAMEKGVASVQKNAATARLKDLTE